jgi:tetratricopeptide (TPR) repeat protein
VTREIETLVDAGRHAHRALVLGDLSAVGSTLRALEATNHIEARAWSAAIRSELWLAEPRYGTRLPASWLSEFVAAPLQAREGAVLALANRARAAVLDFDERTLRELEPLARDLSQGLSDEGVLTADLVCMWAVLARGDAATARERSREAASHAAKAELAALVVEIQALRALASIALGEHDVALDVARRASLMARTEGLPQPEFLAHLSLARARRYARQPHLSLRILEALIGVAPSPWQPWLAWESLLAAGARSPATDHARQDRSPADALHALFCAARAGDRRSFDELIAALVAFTGGFALARTELLELIAALETRRASPTAELSAWRDGQSVLTPPSIHGLRVRASEQDETAAAYVLVQPGERGARMLHWSLALVSQLPVARIPQSQRAQGRVETLLAVLALAGPEGLDEAECFSRTYGFSFIVDVHRGVFDVLLHRARGALGALGEVTRRERSLALEVAQPLLIPDPRVSQRTTDRVLRLLAERGAASARDAAALLGISLRSAQSALSELATSGACDARKDGRSVAYVVEDTIFSEPSKRLVATDLTGLTTPDIKPA